LVEAKIGRWLASPNRSLAQGVKSVNVLVPLGHGFSNVFFLFPSPPQKRVQERGAGFARPRKTGTTLFITLGWGLAAKQSDF